LDGTALSSQLLLLNGFDVGDIKLKKGEGIMIRHVRSSLVSFGLLMLCAAGASAQNANLQVPPQDGPHDFDAFFGASAGVWGRTAAVGAPDLAPPDTSGNPQSQFPFFGVVNIYATDVNRTAWTLSSVLHAPDADPGDFEFGRQLALQGKWLIVASTNAVWIYERTHGNYALTEKIVTAAEPFQLLYRDGVLAFKQGPFVQVYKVNEAGVAHLVSTLTPPQSAGIAGFSGGLSYDPVNAILTVGGMGDGSKVLGQVFFYGLKENEWVLQETLSAPSASAKGFGASMALWGDKLVVGAPSADVEVCISCNETINAGVAYVYARKGKNWLLTQTISTEDAASGVLGLVDFGANMVTNGRYVWIQAPQANFGNASTVQEGPSTLFRWNGDQLALFQRNAGLATATPGGLAMSNRYVIEGLGDPTFGEAASIHDLTLLEGSNSSTPADDPE
jgi:hypothetical protein